MTLVFDTEALESKSDDESWADFRTHAGIGLACVYAVETAQYSFYDHSQVLELVSRLEKADEVVGYNSIGYDHEILNHCLSRPVFIPNETDICSIILAAKDGVWPKGSWSLDKVSERTLGIGKNGSGAFAPQLLREGKIGQLATYLIHDVYLTWRLWEFMRTYGYVVAPDGKQVRVGVLAHAG